MRAPLENRLRIQISSLVETPFQDFVTELYLYRYGTDGFTPMRHMRDKGCDGIINETKTIVACYGPAKYEKRKFDDKADDDFDKYKSHWETRYPGWMMVVNHSLSPDQPLKVTDLKPDGIIRGLDQLLAIVKDEIMGHQRRKICKCLNIEDEFIADDFLGEVLDDLLATAESNEEKVQYSRPIYTPTKIELNYKKDDVEAALREYEILVEYFPKIHNLINSYDDEDINKIKTRVILLFAQQKGAFKHKVDAVTELLLSKYGHEQDDSLLMYVRAVLLYHFEQCLIGKRVAAENDLASS